MSEQCAICGCNLTRGGNYGKPTIEGRSHATKHHYVAERFFGRTANRKGVRPPTFTKCPWNLKRQTGIFCYDCHEELLHNPVLTPKDINKFSELIIAKRLNETSKPESKNKLGGRIKLLHEVIERGLDVILDTTSSGMLKK